MKLKSIGLKLLTTALTALLAFQAPLQSLRVAAASTSYISDMIISYGNTDEEAKNWLTKNGYKIVNQNLNEGGEGGSSAMSWLGLASKKRSVYLGYKTTTKAEEAITDMKIMNMNGGYSYQAYEQVLENTKQEKERFLNNLMPALEEYRANYAAGRTNALIAHECLNKFRDDDSGQLMGDLLLNTLKTEDEAAWEADPTQHADMVTILMQGNSTCVSEIMQNLAIGAGTEEESWINRAMEQVSIQNLDFIAPDEEAEEPETEEELTESTAEIEENEEIKWKNGLELLMDDYQERFPTYDKDTLITLMIAEYDNDAKMMASSLVGLGNLLSNYTQSELPVTATEEEADAYFAEHEFEDKTLYARAANLYYTLSSTYYEGDSLLEYFVSNEDDFFSDTVYLENYEEQGLPLRAKLYPFIAAMSPGQRSLLEYTAMDRMITFGLMDINTWKSTYATLLDEELEADELGACSVYARVNRDDFKVGSIAVTNMAQGKQATTGEPMDNGIGYGISPLSAGISIGGIITTIAGITIAIKCRAYDPLTALMKETNQVYKTVENGNSIIHAGMSNGLPTGMNPKGLTDVPTMIKEINTYDEGLMLTIQTAKEAGIPLDKSYFEALYNDTHIFKLTMPGGNQEIHYANGIKITYKEGTKEFESLTTAQGKIYYADGRTAIDENLQRTYRKFIAAVNPDIKNQIAEISKQMDELAISVGYTNGNEYMQSIDETFNSIDELMKVETNGKSLYDNFYEAGSKYNVVKTGGRVTPLEGYNIRGYSDNQVDALIDYMEGYHSEEKELIQQLKKVQNEKFVSAKKLQKAQNELEEIAGYANKDANAKDSLSRNADDAMTAATGSNFWKWFGVGMAIVGLAMSVYGVYSMISDMKAYYHVEMLPIPRKMVDIGYQTDGSSCYLYYDCVKCNRSKQGMGNDTLEDYGDLNGDVMKQWLALYTTKDRRAGSPITESIVVKKGTTTMPLKTKPLSFFGFESAVNMTDKNYTYNDKKNGIYLYYKVDNNANYTGTVTTNGMLATVGVLSAFGGAGICAALMTVFGKRKKETAAEAA